MKQTIVLIFLSLTAYGSTSPPQQPTTWTNPYFYYHYNTPLALPTQKASANEIMVNQKVFSNYDDLSMQNTLGSHVVLLTTCLRDLKTTKADLLHTHTEVETVKKELKELKENSTSIQILANVMATVEIMKKDMTGMVHKADLAQITQRLDETHTSVTSRVESVKKELKASQAEMEHKLNVVEGVKTELTHVLSSFEAIKKEMNANTPSSIGRMPKSCDDLQKIGHRKSGLFSVVGNKTVDNVYCDFTKPSNDAGFQKTIGHVDVKTLSVYFHAQRSSSYSSLDTITFDVLKLNLGNAMSTSGVFVAPKSGKYYFAYSGISEVNAHARVELQVKTATADWSSVGQAWGEMGINAFSLRSIMELAQGNQIRLMLLQGAIRDHNVNHYTNFVGQLLEEDIIP